VELDVRSGQRAQGSREDLRRRVGGSIVRDDDLGFEAACLEIFSACGEARREPASLVVCREDQ
jgi:hypothetical protein